MDDVADAKAALRAEIRRRRSQLTIDERAAAETGITEQLIALAQSRGATTIAAYLSTPTEPSTRGFLEWAAADGRTVLLPISRADGLLDWARFDGGSEDFDLMGMPSPTGDVLGPAAADDADLIVVPASAVDATGIRMGWGRGFFDRSLGCMDPAPPAYAVVYDSEVLDALPRHPHDHPVRGAVTPTRVIEFTA